MAAITFLLLLYVPSPAGSVVWSGFPGCVRLTSTEVSQVMVLDADECMVHCLAVEDCCSFMIFFMPGDYLGTQEYTCVLDSLSIDFLFADAAARTFPCDFVSAMYYGHSGKQYVL
jgi:hypothetical protein